MKTSLMHAAAIASLLALTACQPGSGPVAQGMDQAQKGLEKASQGMEGAKQEMSKVQEKLATENMSLSDSDHALPKAELTPSGALLIDGKPVAMTPEQTVLGKAYRTQLQGVASDGIAIGMEGAKLGIDAAAAALKGLMSGQGGEAASKQAEALAEQRIKPQVDKLCARLPELLKTQQAWAAAQPEFKPYAKMDQSDVEDCNKNGHWNF
ncbi:hypothetical protein SAMN05428989_2822 [Pseudoxanthomonas sp. GM95]|uniref:hypothetical protein n=1 Tax=Pseudoxanthomonas sp. GM95 TaxID=1881043 RepID=UPI0008C0D21E|nr:hypothetical protein [Pseudoxanthomonas sp. GM95]SEL89795.1 hypothetical protein SAMN05428989_2822 [Pseudoxanthomonas sp. GM95]